MAFWVRLTTSSHASSKSGQDFQGISGSVKLDKEKKMILLGNHTSFFFFLDTVNGDERVFKPITA